MVDDFCRVNRHSECMAPDCECGCHALADAVISYAARLAAVEAAGYGLIEYRDRNMLNFQLEKADDFINAMRSALSVAPQTEPRTRLLIDGDASRWMSDIDASSPQPPEPSYAQDENILAKWALDHGYVLRDEYLPGAPQTTASDRRDEFHEGSRVQMRDGWLRSNPDEIEGICGTVIGKPVFSGQWWLPVKWDDEDDPNWIKMNGVHIAAAPKPTAPDPVRDDAEHEALLAAQSLCRALNQWCNADDMPTDVIHAQAVLEELLSAPARSASGMRRRRNEDDYTCSANAR